MSESSAWVTSEDELRAVLPPPAARTTLKILPRLESIGRTWIRNAGLVGLATQADDGLVETIARAQTTNLAHAPDDLRILISNAPDARIGSADPNLGANPSTGMIAILPGLDSTLRANGTATTTTTTGGIELNVRETYMHCPKAFVRSRLWKVNRPTSLEGLAAEEGESLGAGARSFIAASPFLLLGTCNDRGEADVSPRGDPPGLVAIEETTDTLLLPDRPGNHIADSFRNILARPTAGVLFLVPKVDWALRVSGEARITTDTRRLAALAVGGKAPKLAIELRVRRSALTPAPCLASVWASAETPPKVPSLGRTIVEQVEPKGRFRTLKGKLLDRVLDRDVKTNLY